MTGTQISPADGGRRAGRMQALPAAAYALALVVCFIAATGAVRAQTPDDAPIRELIARLDRGETEAVRQQLPEFVARYQNHPGMLFVQARVATDGIEAAKLYQSVLDNYPSSEWADDALYNLYQYYYAMGLYKTAELKMQQLRKEYPSSEHLTGTRATPSPAGEDLRTESPPLSPPVTRDSAGVPRPPVETGREGQVQREGEKPESREPVAARQEPPGQQPPSEARPDSSRLASPPGQAGQAGRPESQTPAEGKADHPNSTMPYTLQTGAFSTSENARRQKEMFEERGYTAEITNRVRGGRSLHLVWVGSFRTQAEARRVLAEIQSRFNITPIVVER